MLIVSQLTAHKRAQPRKIVQINKESINFDKPDKSADIQKIQGRKSLLSPMCPIDPFDIQQNASEVLVHKKTFSEQQNHVRNTIARNLLTNESVKSNKVANTGSPKR